MFNFSNKCLTERGGGVSGFLNNVKRYAELGHRLPALEAEEGEQEEERPEKQKN